MSTESNSEGVIAFVSSLWPRFRCLPTWAQVVGWLFLWPLVVPVRLLAGPPGRWRSIAAGTAFVVLGFLWSAMCAGVVTGDSAPSDDEAPANVAESTRTPKSAQTDPSASASSSVETSPAVASVVASAAATSTPSSTPAASMSTSTPTPSTTSTAADWTATRIIDGDTLEVQAAGGAVETIRVVGIDTPERGQCGFDEAADALGRLVLGQSVDLVPGAQDERDRYGRLLRYVDVRGVDAGLELIRGGFAIARYDSRDGYGRHDREDAYVAADDTSAPICDSAPQATGAPSAPSPTEAASAGGANSSATPASTRTAPAPTVAPATGVQSFPNCDALRVVYPGGVARVGVTGNTVSGVLRAFKVQPVFDDALYAANTGRDGDGDGVACER